MPAIWAQWQSCGSTLTGDTLGAKGADVQIELAPFPEPAMTYAIEPKTRADEDKLAPAIHKLMEEDLLIRFFRDPQTNEFLIAGAGQPHIEAIVSRLEEALSRRGDAQGAQGSLPRDDSRHADAQGRHKKQIGRARAVWRLQNQDGSAAARRWL